MHTEWDLETYYRTLSNYGVRRHTPAYHAVRGIVRFLTRVTIVVTVVILPNAIAYALIP